MHGSLPIAGCCPLTVYGSLLAARCSLLTALQNCVVHLQGQARAGLTVCKIRVCWAPRLDHGIRWTAEKGHQEHLPMCKYLVVVLGLVVPQESSH